jgi:valyl-tRNA synthetase
MLAHPFAPFLTETIWQTLSWEQDSILANREQQKITGGNKQQAAQFTELQAIVTEIRFIVQALNAREVTLYYKDASFLNENAATIKHLARLQAVSQAEGDSGSDDGIPLINTSHTCWLDIDKATAKAYAQELAAKQVIQKASIKQLEGRLRNKDYVKNAPQSVVAQTKQQLQAAEELLETLKTEERRFAHT